MTMSKKAELGMGTLIIFTAMVLVGAIVAAALLSTAGTLQNKALKTGKDKKKDVGTSINVIQLYAEDGTDQKVEEFTGIIKLNSGSDPINFEELLVTFGSKNQSADYEYNSSIDCDDIATTEAGGTYGMEYSINGSSHRAGYMYVGDVARICFEAPGNVSETQEFSVSLIPKIGRVAKVDSFLPDFMGEKVIRIFP